MAVNAAKSREGAASSEVVWRIELLGRVCLHRDKHVLPSFKTRRMTLLLARLACFPDRAHPRDALAEELWPDEMPDTLRERFRQTLSMLRRELEPEGVPSGSVLIADRSAVRLAPGTFSTDVAEFTATCRAAREYPPVRQIELLQQAVNLYRGELLPGFYEDWILTEREHLAELHRQALSRLTSAYAAVGQFEAAVEIARKAIASNPLCEDSHGALIRVFAQAGRSADARRQYEELERLLRAELDAEPTPQTQRLVEQVRAGELAMALQTAAPTAPAKGAGALPVNVPALPAAPPLPTPMTRFFGREEEMALLVSLLPPVSVSPSASCPPPLVTLTGPGGGGKTRLALEVARRLRPEYNGAVWFVPLADVLHPGLIADAVVETLALSRSAHAAPLEQAIEFLQAYPAALLILDNFEHLQEEGSAYVQALRQRLPRLSCLVTSRHKLNVDGERDLALPPLQTPDVSATPEQLLAYPGIQLFLDRAQAARYSFQLTGDNAAAVAALGQRLEGLPLAIELAAAWAAALAPEQILQRLSRRFDLLVSRRKDIPQRHQSLQAVLEGSYQLLPPTLQRLYARLSIFRGGWTLEAAEQIAGLSERAVSGLSERAPAGNVSGPFPGDIPGDFPGDFHCLDGLAVLQERSFIVSEEWGAEMRYRLLESLREFGAEQLGVDEQRALAQSHAAYFLALTGEVQTRQRTPEEKQWFDRLEAETDNVRAALEWAILNDAETALKMSARLGGFWMTRGLAREGSEWLQKALVAAGGVSQSRADALNGLALMKLSLGNYEEGRELARECLAMLRHLDDKPGMAKALNTLGAIVMEQGNYREAQTCYKECLSLYRALNHRMGESIVLANLGNVVYGQGEYAFACDCYSECLQARRALGDKRGIAAALDYLGRAVREQGDYPRACELHTESLLMRRELNDKPSIALALNHLATVKTHLGEREEARRLLEESLLISEEIGDKGNLAEALTQLGELARIEGNKRAARKYWTHSLMLLQEAGDKSGIAGLLEAFAGLSPSEEQSTEQSTGQAEEQFYNAAQMLGAADAIRLAISSPVRPSQRPHYAQTAAAIRKALGTERFQQAWELGRALTLEQAIQLTKTTKTTGV